MHTTKTVRPALIAAALLIALVSAACESGGYDNLLGFDAQDQAPTKQQLDRR